MEAFERQECQATILRENSAIYIYCCDPYYDKAFTNRWREKLALYRTPGLLFRNWTALNLLVLSNVKASAIFEPFKVSKTMKILYLL